MSQSPTMTVATRRALVRQLTADEPQLSARAIARRLGVSKDTVRRDLEAVSQGAPPGADQEAPPGGDCLTVALTGELCDHLAVLAEAGHTAAEGLSLAAEVLADAYRHAWDYELYPRGTAPRIRAINFHPYAPEGTTR